MIESELVVHIAIAAWIIIGSLHALELLTLTVPMMIASMRANHSRLSVLAGAFIIGVAWIIFWPFGLVLRCLISLWNLLGHSYE